MSGQASPHWPQPTGASSCSPGSAALTQVHKRLDLLTGLGERQERVFEKARQLESDLIDWSDEVEQKVQNVLESFTPETQKPAAATASEAASAAPSAIDSDNVENELLPPPLQPQVFAGWYKICSAFFPLQVNFAVCIQILQLSGTDPFFHPAISFPSIRCLRGPETYGRVK